MAKSFDERLVRHPLHAIGRRARGRTRVRPSGLGGVSAMKRFACIRYRINPPRGLRQPPQQLTLTSNELGVFVLEVFG